MLLLRGATGWFVGGIIRGKSFNTCSSCEEQRRGYYYQAAISPVSIHAPLARSNTTRWRGGLRRHVSIHAPLARSNEWMRRLNDLEKFQYMLLLRGATVARVAGGRENTRFNTCSSCEEQLKIRFNHRKTEVSIHAPLARSNRTGMDTQSSSLFQYMLLLRGATTLQSLTQPTSPFQYMLLLRGATKDPVDAIRLHEVSIHAPLARSNLIVGKDMTATMFQYMLLLRGATQIGNMEVSTFQFQYMLLLRGAT